MNAETEAVEEIETPPDAEPGYEEAAQVQEESQGENNEEVPQEAREEKVPLSALQKERRRRQDAEQKAQWLEELQSKQAHNTPPTPPEEDDDQYEAATKADLKNVQKAALRDFEEKSWVKSNPDKYEDINQNLQNFLKQRPHLTSAIEHAPNRYEEAWTLMNALSPKQKIALKAKPGPTQPTPGSPSSIPKGAGVHQATDVMNMSDSEFRAWRQSMRKRR